MNLKMMKVVFCFCLGLLLLSHGANAADYKNEYKLSVVPGATSGWGKTATYFADLVRKNPMAASISKCIRQASSFPASRLPNF